MQKDWFQKILNWLKETFGETWLVKSIEKIFFSFDNSNRGLSGKKMTALAITYCVVKMHEYYMSYAFIKGDFSLLPVVLGADFTTLLALFGINEYGKNKARVSDPNNTTPSTVAA
jgi:hypothetical protein